MLETITLSFMLLIIIGATLAITLTKPDRETLAEVKRFCKRK